MGMNQEVYIEEVNNSIEINIIHQVHISVRELVEFLLRSGDIDNRFGGPSGTAAMNEGTKVHKRIQGQGGSTYEAEVPLSIVVQKSRYEILIDGRADGIFSILVDELGSRIPEIRNIPKSFTIGGEIISSADKDIADRNDIDGIEEYFDYRAKRELIFIDEIKGVYRDVTLMEEPVPVHHAQAMVYAYIVATQETHDYIGVQMTYCDMDTDTIRRFIDIYTRSEIENWFDNLMDEYAKWADLEYDHMLLRNNSADHFEFPYEYRPGQKELCQDVYRTLLRKKNLFIQAPTGTGKTINSLFPAVKAFPNKLADKIFYVTAKTVTASVAIDTAKFFHDRNCHTSCVQIVAKEKMCILDAPACNPEDCPFAKGHFDRINDALYDVLTHEEMCTREVVAEYAAKHEVCPFELSLDISSFSDIIIGDYNYIFDPTARLKRFFAGGLKGNYVFLVDEAHNLPDRAREMFSAEIKKEDVLETNKLVKKYSKRCEKHLTRLNKIMLEYKRECKGLTEYEHVDLFYTCLCNVYDSLKSLMEKRIRFEGRDEVAQFYFDVASWVDFYENRDEKYLIYTRQTEENFCIRIYCADPSTKLQQCLDQARATVFFSATFLPINYYKSLLSTKEDNYAVYANSIFKQENRLLLIGKDVTSKYTSRGADTYRRVADYIIQMVLGKSGNYMAFFPSYAFMDSVFEVFEKVSQDFGMDCDTIVQSKNMKESDREAFLSRFRDARQDLAGEKSLVGFCVLGGIFSEGIDLTDESLIGAIIVGTGLGGIDEEQELLKKYFDKNGMNGFDYVYRYPGMNRVAQAAGRVIRTVTDKGIILLLDDRFLQRENYTLFPREWSDARTVTIDKLSEEINTFWSMQ